MRLILAALVLAVAGAPARRGRAASPGRGGDGCVVDLWLTGPFLVARDNMRCGGMNVTFTGVYRR